MMLHGPSPQKSMPPKMNFAVNFKYGDPDGDKLQIEITKGPENGLIWSEFGEWLYLPDNHFNGKDSIRFRVTDGKLTSKEAT